MKGKVITDYVLKPLVDAHAKDASTAGKLAVAMKRRGVDVSRQNVHGWLSRDKAKRREPRLGHAVAMVAAYEEVREQ
jgi:hypothetical protein